MARMTGSAAAEARRGRPPGFDRDQVVDTLTRLFWERGFDRTGHADIRARTGLSGSSLVNAFGDKAAIFDVALAHYQDLIMPWVHSLAGGSEGVADLERYLDALDAHIDDDGTPAGCLMISTEAQPIRGEPAVRTRTQAYRDAWRAAFTAALRRGESRGELRPGSTADRAWLLLAVHTGVMIAAVEDPSGEEARRMVMGARDLLADWRPSDQSNEGGDAPPSRS